MAILMEPILLQEQREGNAQLNVLAPAGCCLVVVKGSIAVDLQV